MTGNISHAYSNDNNQTVKIYGTFPAIYFNGNEVDTSSNTLRINSISAWGDIKWQSMSYAFSMCKNLNVNSIDNPDLTTVTDMSYMFFYAESFNQSINSWDVSNITNMEGLFSLVRNFNQPLNNWDVSNVTNMKGTFSNTYSYNQSLNNWDVSNVTNMESMFKNADSFNQQLNNWNVSNVTNMGAMFSENSIFNQDIGNWNTSSAIKMGNMFRDTSAFTNHDLSGWSVGNIADHTDFMTGAGAGNTEPSW